MKLKFTSLFIILFACINIKSQEIYQKKGFNTEFHPINPINHIQPELPILFGSNNLRVPAADRYILDIKTLQGYFKDKKIPKRFPLYDNNISFEENKQLALLWTKRNKRFLTKEKRDWLSEKSKL